MNLIQVKELRIGSVVYDTEFSRQDVVIGIKNDRVSLRQSKFPYTPLNNIFPIPVIPVMLERAKFCFDTTDGWYIFTNKDGLSVSHDIGGETYFFGNMGEWVEVPKRIQYMHQMQNFVYVYTGEELEIDLTPTSQPD